MASRAKYNRVESEIDKHRVECNWKKSVELAKQWSAKSPELGIADDFHIQTFLGLVNCSPSPLLLGVAYFTTRNKWVRRWQGRNMAKQDNTK